MDIKNFKTKEYALGYTISNYTGHDSIVTIPSTINDRQVKNIGEYSFNGNKSIKHVIISPGIKRLCFYAFGDCSNLETVRIPNTVTDIFTYAFANCYSLKTVFFEGTEEEWKRIPFADLDFKHVQVVFRSKSKLSEFINDISEDTDKELKDK